MNKHVLAARGFTALALTLSLGFGLAGFGPGPAKAESRGTFDAATSLAVGTGSVSKAASSGVSTGTRTLGFTGSAATEKTTVSAAPATARSIRFGDDASLPVGGVGQVASTTKTEPGGTASGFASSTPYHNEIAKHARANGVPVALALAVVRIESNYNSKARGRAGEVGLMQIKPRTARGMGFTGSTASLYDPNTNLQWGMKYLAGAYQRAGGDTCGTIMRYQGGHYATRMSRAASVYCSKVKNHMAGKWA